MKRRNLYHVENHFHGTSYVVADSLSDAVLLWGRDIDRQQRNYEKETGESVTEEDREIGEPDGVKYMGEVILP